MVWRFTTTKTVDAFFFHVHVSQEASEATADRHENTGRGVLQVGVLV